MVPCEVIRLRQPGLSHQTSTQGSSHGDSVESPIVINGVIYITHLFYFVLVISYLKMVFTDFLDGC